MLAHGAEPMALPSLQSYTGIWDMPTARVMPDWNMRLKYGYSDPHRYYGGALGIFDRLEFHGQFTEVSTIEAFVGQGYGHYKDRSAGARLVLLKEGFGTPQVAIGAFDATGTALYGSRYLTMTKMIGDFDVTFGLGQGVLAGEFVRGETYNTQDQAFGFLLSDPFRKTEPFGGIEWYIRPDLILSAEYTSIDPERLFGFVNSVGSTRVKENDRDYPVNVGLKYRIGKSVTAQAGLMGGSTVFMGIGMDWPLDAGELLGWRKKSDYVARERDRVQIAAADPNRAATLLAERLQDDGFSQVEVYLGESSVWIEAATPQYLSESRAAGRMGKVAHALLPERIKTLYVNIRYRDQTLTSMKFDRANFEAYQESRLDWQTLIDYGRLDLYAYQNWDAFTDAEQRIGHSQAPSDWFDLSVSPKVRTFLNNRAGFFKHKAVVRNTLSIRPWRGGLVAAAVEVPFYNQYDELVYNALEREAARTDIKLFEQRVSTHINTLAFDQIFELPKGLHARVSAGLFEAPYAGFGAELFRYFNEGRWGIGLEAEAVRKRDPENDFALHPTDENWRTPAYVNLYAQLWPDQGIEGSLKIGRFLAGDTGASLEIRRTFKYFTIGAWYTRTDTSVFNAPQNIDAEAKGVFISIPMAFFKERESKGRVSYAITSFTRDQGQMVIQPRSLYPRSPLETPDYFKRHIDDMRQ